MRRSLVLIALVLGLACASPGSSRDALLRIVSDCLDTSASRYCGRCTSPQAGTCDLEYPCTRTTEVWAQTEEYVAIRDLKMCGCPDGFVHGLAMSMLNGFCCLEECWPMDSKKHRVLVGLSRL